MPIENERKYVLKLDTPKMDKIAKEILNIEQTYLVNSKKQTLRIRKTNTYKNNWLTTSYSMTFKQTVDKKTVEIEVPLSPDDYVLLDKDSILKFNKIRYVVGNWEIDFFITKDNKVYFVQAEYEMPDGQEKPKSIPSFIKDNLVHVVARGDGRFANKKLGDMKYAQKLIKTLNSRRK